MRTHCAVPTGWAVAESKPNQCQRLKSAPDQRAHLVQVGSQHLQQIQRATIPWYAPGKAAPATGLAFRAPEHEDAPVAANQVATLQVGVPHHTKTHTVGAKHQGPMRVVDGGLQSSQQVQDSIEGSKVAAWACP